LERKAKIVVSEPSEARRNFAAKLGPIETLNPFESTPPLSDVVIECVGLEGMLQQAAMYAARNGKIIAMGAAMTPETLIPLMWTLKELELKFGLGYTFDEFKEALDAIASKRINVKGIISDIISLDQLPATFAELLKPNNKSKVLIEY
jgi:threonine dehydrogenase-like Zn-dependent dehydrogenase